MPEMIKLDNVEAGILGDFLKRWSRLGVEIEIEHGEDGTMYFIGGQGETCTVTPDGSCWIDVNYH